MERPAKSLKELVDGVINSIRGPGKDNKIAGAWAVLMDDDTKAHTKLAGFKKGTLSITVSDSGRLYQLSLKKTALINEINKKAGTKKVKSIRLKIGEV